MKRRADGRYLKQIVVGPIETSCSADVYKGKKLKCLVAPKSIRTAFSTIIAECRSNAENLAC